MKRPLSVIALTFLLVVSATTNAIAGDSVSVPGQVSADQCPSGYQYSVGISVNVTTHETTTICNAPPNDAEILLRQQDEDFRQRQDAAIARAQAESAAWNAANPGQQKCIQWGPIVHANGITTASGGVCANPVDVPNGIVAPIQNTEPISGDVTLRSPAPGQPITQPFSVQVSGQVGVEGCPAGYQAANGLEVNATTGQISTVCWSDSAWKANKLGGETWNQFVATSGAVDVDLEIERRAAVAALKSQALLVAQAAADSTPGVKRCTHWTGYGETGDECAYTFVNPNTLTSSAPSVMPVGTQEVSAGAQVITSLSTMAAALKATSLTSSTKAAAVSLFSKLQKLSWSKGKKTVTLPNALVGNVNYKSATPKICSVKGLVVTDKKPGNCEIQTVLTANPWTKFSTIKRLVLQK